uniref:Uncharacterized protein n=1 Tax=Avena sativa TaxID=4498 RepID=A0ACD5V6F0_AVESA
MEPDRGLIAREEPLPLEPMDLLSSAWCSSAIQVLQTGPVEDRSLALVEHPVVALDDDRRDLSQLQRSDRSLVVDNSSFGATQTPWKYDDLKSWIWLQKAIHPELDYDNKKKWLPRKMAAPWSGVSLKKWVKERKQKRKEEARLHRAEVHAAVSVAGVAAVLAAIAAENSAPGRRGSGSASASMRETSVASAAALVAAQCAKVAEAAGATREQVAAAVGAAVASTDASNVITLTAAAATSLRGAAALRGRRGGSGRHGQSERGDQAGSAPWQDDLDFDFNYARSKAALAKGDEMFVAMPDGKWKLHTVSAACDRNGKLVLRIKKMSLVMQAFSNARECIVEDVSPCAPEKASREEDATYPIEVTTSRGKVELRADDYAVYKRWVTTVTHMITSSTAITVRN